MLQQEEYFRRRGLADEVDNVLSQLALSAIKAVPSTRNFVSGQRCNHCLANSTYLCISQLRVANAPAGFSTTKRSAPLQPVLCRTAAPANDGRSRNRVSS